jgi:hypothetical protein
MLNIMKEVSLSEAPGSRDFCFGEKKIAFSIFGRGWGFLPSIHCRFKISVGIPRHTHYIDKINIFILTKRLRIDETLTCEPTNGFLHLSTPQFFQNFLKSFLCLRAEIEIKCVTVLSSGNVPFTLWPSSLPKFQKMSNYEDKEYGPLCARQSSCYKSHFAWGRLLE